MGFFTGVSGKPPGFLCFLVLSKSGAGFQDWCGLT
jgi:hypothetical protein